MNNLNREIENILINKNLGAYVNDIKKINQYYNDNCKSEFNANIHGHVIISKLRFIITINMNRMKFLTQSYIVGVNSLNPLSCNIILRSLMETSAVLTYLFKTIYRLAKSFNGDLEDILLKLEELPDKLSFGDKSNPETPTAVNVLTTIKTIDGFNSEYNVSKSGLNFVEIYAHLCEIAHPNYEGYLLNMLQVEKSLIRILDENRNFSEMDYQIKVFIEVNRIYRAAINYTTFITDKLDQ